MTPLGHILAGTAAYLAVGGKIRDIPAHKLRFGAFIFAACAADLDLLSAVFFPGSAHRGATHSLVFALVLASLLLALVRRFAGPAENSPAADAAGLALCTLSHPLIDYFTADFLAPYGIQLLWPFSRAYFESGHPVFSFAFRSPPSMILCAHNLRTFFLEINFGLLLCLFVFLLRRARKGGAA